MRIQHNIPAMNSYRNYTANTKAVAKNLEKLSSGYRINRAGDDAAGLAISEKMRAQITGLKTAQKNAKDGISLIQTAEGALTEVHSMLNRMVELANQSANGTFDDITDRDNLQKEISQLKSEIDRIADSTNFNGIKLLDGSLSADAKGGALGKQLLDIGATVPTLTTSAGRSDATAAKSIIGYATADATDLVDATKYDAYEITFKNKNGEQKTITLVENAKDAIAADTGASLANALKGTSNGLTLSLANGSSEADLAEFRELFDIGSTTGGAATAPGTPVTGEYITIQAKDASSGAGLVSFKHGQDATGVSAGDAIAALAATAPVAQSLKAEPAGYGVDFNTATAKADLEGTGTDFATNGLTFKIGSTTYEVAAAGSTVKDGNVAITAGVDDAATIKNLAAQLKKDGFNVEISANDATKIIFTDTKQLETDQAGTQISSSSSSINIDKVEASKQKTKITLGAGANTDNTSLVFNYVDAEGKAQSKTLTYKNDTGASNAATNLVKAINDDAELVKYFKVENTGADISIEARGTGSDAGQFSGMVLGDATQTQIVSKTAGAYEGKSMSLKTGENLKSGDTVTVDGVTYEFTSDSNKKVGNGNVAINLGANGTDTMKNLSKELEKAGVKHSIDATGKLTFADKDGSNKGTGGLTLQIGDTAEAFNKLTVSVGNMHAKNLGIGDINIGTQDGASAAIDKIKSAINSVSSTRGDLGAAQNRLDHTINNLSVMTENIQDAESSIRDVDVADEMMAYTKNNILVQSAQAMLAQANQLPQGVLQLLG